MTDMHPLSPTESPSPATPGQLLELLRRAISDPGARTPRRVLHEGWAGPERESLAQWSARAVLAALEQAGLLTAGAGAAVMTADPRLDSAPPGAFLAGGTVPATLEHLLERARDAARLGAELADARELLADILDPRRWTEDPPYAVLRVHGDHLAAWRQQPGAEPQP